MAPDRTLPDPERARRHLGLGLYILGMLLGFLQLIIWFVGLPVLAGEGAILMYMCMGAVLAFPAGVMYLTFPRLLDRYGHAAVPDREAAMALAGVRPEYLRAAYEAIEAEFEGVEQYLERAVGLHAGARETLRSRLVR